MWFGKLIFGVSAICMAQQSDLSSIAKSAVNDFARQDFTGLYNYFSDDIKTKIITPHAFQGMVGPVRESFGEFRKLGDPIVSDASQGIRTFTFPAEFSNGNHGLAISLDNNGKMIGFRVVPVPLPAAKAGDLMVVTGKYQLTAVLKMPDGSGPFPLVVLVHGSGPQDMDETVGSNKPFRDLAEGLAKLGVATLRYNKRTRQYPSMKIDEVTLDTESVDDAVSAAAMARKMDKIDPRHVFVLGHSQGGLAAPRIGVKDPTLAGLILVAGPARPMDAVIDDQIRYLGLSDKVGEQLKHAFPPAFRKQLEEYKQVEVAKTLKMPMFIIQGERDYQVTMEDFALWKSALGTSQNVTMKSYPKLNHLLQEGQGKAKPAEYNLAKPVASYVIDDVATWVKSH